MFSAKHLKFNISRQMGRFRFFASQAPYSKYGAKIPLFSVFLIFILASILILIPEVEGAKRIFQLQDFQTVIIGNPKGIECIKADPQKPCGWPGLGSINQGPNSPDPNDAHGEAIDIGGPNEQKVYATLDGVLKHHTPSTDPFCGEGVEIYPHKFGFSSGFNFHVRYCHFVPGSRIGHGTNVRRGQVIGRQDTTGNADGTHIHYAFFGLPMAPPYIPEVVPDGCFGDCGITITSLGFAPLP